MSELLLNMLSLLGFSSSRVRETRDNGADAVSLTELKAKFAELKNAAASVTRIPDLEKKAARLIEVQNELEAAKKRESELIQRLGQLARAGAERKSKQSPAKSDELEKTKLRNAVVTARVKRGMGIRGAPPVSNARDDLRMRGWQLMAEGGVNANNEENQ